MGRAALVVGLCTLAGCRPGGERSATPERMHVRIEQPPQAAPAKPTRDRAEPSTGLDPSGPSNQPNNSSPSSRSAVGVLKPPTDRPSCELQLTLGLEGSVLAEHHERSGWEDFHIRFPAYPIDRATFEPVRSMAEFTVDDQPVFWFTPNGGRVVVDHTFSSDLEAVDAFAVPVGGSAPVGSLEPAALGRTAAWWVELLLRARVVATWAEGPAELCIDWRETEGDAFDAYVQGVRTGPGGAPQRVHFLVRVDLDGGISVVGLPR